MLDHNYSVIDQDLDLVVLKVGSGSGQKSNRSGTLQPVFSRNVAAPTFCKRPSKHPILCKNHIFPIVET
jgi:hypothetical protein